jgi:hypothetical protein
MRKGLSGTTVAVLALIGAAGVAAAQSESVQPGRNDPPPPPPNQSRGDSVPPATDPSLPTRGGKQEPSSKIEGTDPNAAILADGMLTVPGAQADLQTAPAKFSRRTDAADQLPIAAFALRHLTREQRGSLYHSLRPLALSSEASALSDAVIGSEVPTEVALGGLKQLPKEVVSRFPELSDTAFAHAGDKVLLVNPRLGLVLAVLE